MAQTIQIRRTTTNTPPATLPQGSFSVELGTDTRLWMGDGTANRLLSSSNPADVGLDADCVVSATPPALTGNQSGVLWFDTVSGSLFLRFNDGTSSQWIAPAGAAGPLNLQTGPGLTLNAGTTPPTIDVATPYLSTVGGTLAGPGNLVVRGGILGGAAGSVPGAGSLTLNANTVAPPAGLTPNTYVVGANNVGSVIGIDCFSNNQFDTAGIFMRRSRGTAAAPAAVQNGDELMSISSTGYGTAYGAGNAAAVNVLASENWTATGHGTNLYLQTTPAGTASPVNSLTLAGNSATFSGTISMLGTTITMPGSCSIVASNINGNMTLASGNDFNITPTGNMNLTQNTAFKPGGGPWSTPSAREIKQDIAPYERGLNAVLALKPVSYRYNDKSGYDTKPTYIGLVHDETAHMPEMHTTAVLGGTADKPGREVDALDCSAVTWALCNAIKELTTRLEKLEGAR